MDIQMREMWLFSNIQRSLEDEKKFLRIGIIPESESLFDYEPVWNNESDLEQILC